jgi:hypothetical protein
LAEVAPDASGPGAVEWVLVVDAGLQEELMAEAIHRGTAICKAADELFSEVQPMAPVFVMSGDHMALNIFALLLSPWLSTYAVSCNPLAITPLCTAIILPAPVLA